VKTSQPRTFVVVRDIADDCGWARAPSSGTTRVSPIQPINRPSQPDDDIGDSRQGSRHGAPTLLITYSPEAARDRLPEGKFGSSDQAVQLGGHGLFQGPEIIVTGHGWSLPRGRLPNVRTTAPFRNEEKAWVPGGSAVLPESALEVADAGKGDPIEPGEVLLVDAPTECPRVLFGLVPVLGPGDRDHTFCHHPV